MRAPSLLLVSLLATTVTAACDRSAPTLTGPDTSECRSTAACLVTRTPNMLVDANAEDHMRREGTEGSMLPFKARYTFHFVSGPVEACSVAGFFRTYGAGEGTGTHLGHFSVTASQCGLPGGITEGGRGTYTAANGDLLYFTYTGRTSRTGFTVNLSSSGTFVGGTGRFEGATGSATAIGSVDLSTGKAWDVWTGTISLPHSNHGDEGHSLLGPDKE
jgi:hypothetical protein